MLEFDMQWTEIMEDGPFSEMVEITTSKSEVFSVKGVFYEGNYTEDAATSYAPKKSVHKVYFQLSERTLTVTDKELQNAKLVRNNKEYRVIEVKGFGSGMMTLNLQARSQKNG